jgi:serine/threonine-protein kinase RsbW
MIQDTEYKMQIFSITVENRDKTFHLKIPSQANNLATIREFVAKIAQNSGFSENDISKIELAVDEACTNVIKHAYENQPNSKDIEVNVEFQGDKLTIIVTDYGKGFEPEKIQSPNIKKYLAEHRRGGFGIYLMKTLMDEVHYDIQPGIRNKVTMIKYLTQPKNGQ